MVIFVGPGVEETLHSTCIELAPYAHQVGGHVGVLALDKQTVCKPHIDQEYQFYNELPRDLVKFVPKFKGVADVVVKKARDGYLNMVAFPYPRKTNNNRETTEKKHLKHWTSSSEQQKKIGCVSRMHNSQTRSKNSKPLYRVRFSQGGSLSIDQESDSDDLFEDMSTESGYRRFGCNPWSMHCHRQQIAKMQKTEAADQSHKFLLLENVADQFHHPCILDLKMGIRSYGDDATEAKKQSHMAKVEGTTSAKLGVRACGMQIYRPDKGRYICRNKYYGRRLSEEGLRQAVEEFVFNGNRVRVEVIEAIMKEIQGLIETLSELDSYRFFGSSLLIIYEGSDNYCGSNFDTNVSPQFSQSCSWTETHRRSDPNIVKSGTQTEQDLGFHEELTQTTKELDFREEDSGLASDWDSERSGLEEDEEEEEAARDLEEEKMMKSDVKECSHNSGKQTIKRDETQELCNRKNRRTNPAISSSSASSSLNIPDLNHHKASSPPLQRNHHNVQDPKSGSRLAQIKMIDFAHTEFRELSGTRGETYEGPDSDFVFGLENLLRIFSDILNENACGGGKDCATGSK